MANKSVYLSPSTQGANMYSGGYGSEREIMNQLTDLVEPMLSALTVYRNRPEMSLTQAVSDSNAKKPDLHVAIHSNAAGAAGGVARGSEIWVVATGGQAEKAAKKILDEVIRVTGKSRGVKVSTALYEVKATTAPAVILEVDFHDNLEGAKFIVENKQALATAIAKGILAHFGLTLPQTGSPAPETPSGQKTITWEEAGKLLGVDKIIVKG